MHKNQLLVALFFFFFTFLTDNLQTVNYACLAPKNTQNQIDENPKPDVWLTVHL